MDKNAIKKYAVWARNELIARVSQRAQRYGITKDQIVDANADSVNGIILTDTEKKQRQALIQKIREKGFEQVMEEVAYTWFNRFSALRFMEVNGYLPSHVRVFTDQNNAFKPEIMAEAIHLDLDGLDMEKVYALKEANNDDELFKYLTITQCNDLSRILPGMFQKIADYTELLFPDNLLREGSVIEQMIALIPEEDWKDQVQIIGWLYQYYNSEPKDQVFADLKKNKKITKEKIPAATQLFTPDWIVRYMVENSLGRLWVEGHSNDELKSQWKYYLDEAEQEPDVQKQLTEIRKEYSALKPEEIKCIDPCCGSGHILAYMFDVLVQIYGAYGISARDAAASIVKNNIYGLDIDERAAQLAQFSVMMKARQYDRRFFSRDVQPNVYAIEDSNGITSAPLHDMGISLSSDDYGKAVKQIMKLIDEFHDAREYGSIINVSEADWDLLRRFAVPRWMSEGGQISFEIHGEIDAAPRLQQLINIGQALSQKYHVVVTNPPYMGSSGMSPRLSGFVKENYPIAKSDLSTVFMQHANELCKSSGYYAMINIPVWMFLSTYEKLRTKMIENNTFVNMIHFGRGVFGADFGTTAFVINNKYLRGYKGTYRRLFDKPGAVDTVEKKEKWFFEGKGIYFAKQDNYAKVIGSPIAYWMSANMLACFSDYKTIGDVATPASGTSTGNNDLFLKLWHEVPFGRISFDGKNGEATDNKWYPCNKGGAYRKWAGGSEYVINWENDGYEVKHCPKAYLRNVSKIFLPGLTWSKLGSGPFSIRYFGAGYICESIGCCLFEKNTDLFLILGLLNTSLAAEMLKLINPTLGRQPGYIGGIPFHVTKEYKELIHNIVRENIEISLQDWDSYETSWGFKRHPLIQNVELISDAYSRWKNTANERFIKLKNNEEELNRIFVSIYNLNGEISCSVNDEDISVKKASLNADIRSFISYFVGCAFGRYSLDADGLVYAGGTFDYSKYKSFPADHDNILPICDDEYFEDDIVGLFVKFISAVYGNTHLEENLDFIASALGGKGSSRQVIRNYFLNDFYKDHCKTYQKKPIYWLFDSGKYNGFKALIYMHRYKNDTIARIRTDYVHEQQSRYKTAIDTLEQLVDQKNGSERIKVSKQMEKLKLQQGELRTYEEKIHHLADRYIQLDLNDGVSENYSKIGDVLAPIK